VSARDAATPPDANQDDKSAQNDVTTSGGAAPAGEESAPRIGVYVCQCGGNISDVVDVDRVVETAAGLPGVVVSRTNTFMCSDPGQNAVLEDIEKEDLDAVVVAACSPKLHETTFRRVLERGGRNQYLLEQANIREQVSWATGDGLAATEKAQALVAAAVAKAGRLRPLDPIRVETTARTVVVGGGVAGLRAAADLARAGIEVVLVERGPTLGGNAAVLDRLFPTEETAADVVTRLVEDVLAQSQVTILLEATVESAGGYVGNFDVTVTRPLHGMVLDDEARAAGAATGRFVPFEGYVFDAARKAVPEQQDEASREEAPPEEGHAEETTTQTVKVKAGAVVVATGFEHYVPRKGEYGFERIPQVLALPDFIRWLASVQPGPGLPEYEGSPVARVAFIHCVGSRQAEGVNKPQPDGRINEYCSRVCCTATLQAICELLEKRPDVATFDFYQDIRAYGRGHEEYYERASKGGTVFVRWGDQEPPVVAKAKPADGAPVLVRARDGLTWGEEVEAPADLVVLAVGMQPSDVSSIVDSLKLPVGTDRFLQEVHPKLRPVELSVNGVLVAGTSQGPKDITETTASASAAAAKAMALLSSGYVELDPFVAHVDATRCRGAGACVEECGYPGAIELQDYEDGGRRAVVNPALCSGCGACVAVCPERAIDLAGWTLDQYDAMVDAIIAGSEAPSR
jgi:heterodisulfide reductase subunit A